MTRVVLDTNVVVSGVLSAAGPPAWIVDAVLTGDLELAFDATIRLEYEDVLRRREFGLPTARVQELLAAFDRFGLFVTAAPPLDVALPDPDDEPQWESSRLRGLLEAEAEGEEPAFAPCRSEERQADRQATRGEAGRHGQIRIRRRGRQSACAVIGPALHRVVGGAQC